MVGAAVRGRRTLAARRRPVRSGSDDAPRAGARRRSAPRRWVARGRRRRRRAPGPRSHARRPPRRRPSDCAPASPNARRFSALASAGSPMASPNGPASGRATPALAPQTASFETLVKWPTNCAASGWSIASGVVASTSTSALHPPGVAAGEQPHMQPGHRVAADDERAGLAERRQQRFEIADDGLAVARLRAGLGETEAGAVVGQRAQPLGRQPRLHRRPVGREPERAGLQHDQRSGRCGGTLGDGAQPPAGPDLDHPPPQVELIHDRAHRLFRSHARPRSAGIRLNAGCMRRGRGGKRTRRVGGDTKSQAPGIAAPRATTATSGCPRPSSWRRRTASWCCRGRTARSRRRRSPSPCRA